jgi:RP/EB family microtubule-associated protein
MQRVKMNAKMEYEYLENFKILQKAFSKHRIDKVGLFCRRLCFVLH